MCLWEGQTHSYAEVFLTARGIYPFLLPAQSMSQGQIALKNTTAFPLQLHTTLPELGTKFNHKALVKGAYNETSLTTNRSG